MTLYIERPWMVIDASKTRLLREATSILQPDTYEIESIPNPYPKAQSPFFFVLKGTMIGACDYFWLEYAPRLNWGVVRVTE